MPITAGLSPHEKNTNKRGGQGSDYKLWQISGEMKWCNGIRDNKEGDKDRHELWNKCWREKKKSLHRGIKHKLISTKTSSCSTAQYLLRRRSVPKKVDTFSESSCRLDFPSRSQTRLRGNTWHSRPIQTLSPTNNCWHSCAALSLPTKKRKGQNWNATAERKAERLAAVCLSPVFLCFHFSLLPGFSAVSVATTLLSPPCLPLCSFFPLLASLLLPLRLPLKKKNEKTNPSSNSGKALPACLPALPALPACALLPRAEKQCSLFW